MIFHANGNKKAGMAILIVDKTDFKAKRQRSTLYNNERFNTARDITTKNIYAHNDKMSISEAKSDRIEKKKRINSSTIIVGDFNISLSNEQNNQPEDKEIEDLTQ